MASGSRVPKPEFEDDDEPESDPRATIKPAYDVERYAEDTVHRERMVTIVDAVATEEARVASVLMHSSPPTRASGGHSGEVEVDLAVEYSEVEELDPDEQLALLRAQLAPLSRVPALTRRMAELGPVIADAQTAYVLGFIDGLLPLETI